MSNEILISNVKARAPWYLGDKLRSEGVIGAMLQVDRRDFLPTEYQYLAYDDDPVPIGYGQSCSQPSMVAFMLDELDIAPGQKILEIGSGCGYAAAIASRLCSPGGIVYACEIIPELSEMARFHLGQSSKNVQVINADGSAGFPGLGPFNRIFLSAGVAFPTFKKELLLNQLTADGILLFPKTCGDMYCLRRSQGSLQEKIYPGVRFVPLKGINS